MHVPNFYDLLPKHIRKQVYRVTQYVGATSLVVAAVPQTPSEVRGALAIVIGALAAAGFKLAKDNVDTI
jgi:hypothetical protein